MGAVGTSADNALADRSTQPSNAKSSKTTAAGPMRPPAAARSSDGWPATTPKEGTHTAVISAPPPTKGTRHPLRCPKPHNHKSRVHYPGSRPHSPIALKIRASLPGSFEAELFNFNL